MDVTLPTGKTGVMASEARAPETIPILPSADFDATESFWGLFGFGVRGRWDDYLVLRHEELAIELHFWLDRAVDRWTNDVACYVRFPDPQSARAQHAKWVGIEVPEPAVKIGRASCRERVS
jgi:hypothetical protein